jgi:hypothetical protein
MIGWFVIAVLLILFLFNFFSTIAIEWPNIKEFLIGVRNALTIKKSTETEKLVEKTNLGNKIL